MTVVVVLELESMYNDLRRRVNKHSKASTNDRDGTMCKFLVAVYVLV